MSISLPGLARFGCDLSATVGGIPNFGQAFRSRDIRERSEGLTAAVIAPAAGWLVISPAGWRVFHQLIQELRLVPWPRSPPAAIDDRAFAGTRNPATRNPSLLRKEWSLGPQFRMHRPVWRFGNSRAKEYRVRRTDRYIRLSDNLLLGRFGPPTLP